MRPDYQIFLKPPPLKSLARSATALEEGARVCCQATIKPERNINDVAITWTHLESTNFPLASGPPTNAPVNSCAFLAGDEKKLHPQV